MASAKINIFASFVGQAWTALLGIIFVPIYLRYIGVESYGLIGIFMSLQTFLNLLDFGISPTLNREMARLSVSEKNAQEMHDLRRTLQIPNWLSAIAISLVLCILSPIIAKYWVTPKELSVSTITQAFLLISFSTGIQFLSGFNAGGLVGLQKQVLLNSINMFCGTLRSVGAWMVLAFITPTIQAFLWWQLLVAAIQAILTSIAFKKSLFYSTNKGRFRKDLLSRVWRFAAGMTGTGVLALVIAQTDKIILSRMLDLKEFGYYSVAITISSITIAMIVGSISNVVYPKFSGLVSLGNENITIQYYHRACQLLSLLLIPTVVVIAFFSYEVVLIWARNSEIADYTHLLLTLVIIGSGLNGLFVLPHNLQMAYGWTRLGIYLLIVGILIILPLIIAGVYFYGAVGGISGWIIYNCLIGSMMVLIMHRRILKGEQWTWFFKDILPAVSSAVIFNTIVYYFLNDYLLSLNSILQIAILGMLLAFTLFISAISLSSIRNIVLRRIFGYE